VVAHLETSVIHLVSQKVTFSQILVFDIGENLQQQYNQLELFTGSLPTKPYCTDDLTTGLRIRCVDNMLMRFMVWKQRFT